MIPFEDKELYRSSTSPARLTTSKRRRNTYQEKRLFKLSWFPSIEGLSLPAPEYWAARS
jgi:hypothetical protein